MLKHFLKHKNKFYKKPNGWYSEQNLKAIIKGTIAANKKAKPKIKPMKVKAKPKQHKVKFTNAVAKLEENIIYRLENTTTRNAYWEIWVDKEVYNDDESEYVLFSRFGKMGHVATRTTEEDWGFGIKSLEPMFNKRINEKLNRDYVYVGAYNKKDEWQVAKPPECAKQKGGQKIKEIDTNEFTKQIFKRIIKFKQEEPK